jgi:large subunit ribosomal protein L30
MADVILKQVRSSNGASPKQRDTLRSLRLGRIGREATMTDTPQLRGMIRVVEHLVEVDGKGGS